MADIVAVDFESFYDKKAGYSVTEMSYETYCRDPRFDAYMVSVYGGPGNPINFTGEPSKFDWTQLNGKTICAHNAEFDWQVAFELVRRGIIPAGIKTAGWICTADMAAYFYANRSLKKAAKALLGREMSKAMRDKMSGVSWAEAKMKGWAPAMLEYGNGDAVASWEICTQYLSKWPAHEQRLSAMTRINGRRGVALNVKAVREANDLLTMEKFEAEQIIPWEWPSDKTPLNAKDLAIYCRSVGIPPPVSVAEDAPACIAWEAEYGDRYPVVGALRRWRKANTHHHRARRMLSALRADNTIPSYILYWAAHTGRWGGDRGINFQNQPKDPIEFLFHGERKVIDFRGMVIPRPGFKFMCPDLSQIEPRVLNWMVGNTKFLADCRKFSPYTSYARQFYGWTGGDELKTQNKDLYKACKATVLGCGYGCGGPKFKATAKILADYDIDEEQALAKVKEFRRLNPLITGLWERLAGDMRRAAVNNDPEFSIELPSGREMRYFNPVSLGGELTAQNEINGPRRYFYGGKLTENITQAAARDIFGHGVLSVNDQCDIHQPFTVHDESIMEVPEATTQAQGEEIVHVFCTPPDWAKGVPVASEWRFSDRYLK